MKNNLEINVENFFKNLFLSGTIIGFVITMYYALLNITNPQFINIILMLPFIFGLTPYLFLSLYSVKKVESKMAVVPRFLRDIVDNVESGMDLISSIKNTQLNEYVVLNKDIKKLSNQLAWGIDFEEALINFANNVGSSSLKRDFILVIEARKVGGHVEKILRELSEKINVENLRSKERKSNLATNTYTGYISFIIFLFIIIIVYNNLFLGIGSSLSSNTPDGGTDPKISLFLSLLIFLSYELALLSGFLFGLMESNNILSGAPHVVILILFTFIGFFFFIQF